MVGLRWWASIFLTHVCTPRTSCEGRRIAVAIDKGAKYKFSGARS